jgi:hypothetical protein
MSLAARAAGIGGVKPYPAVDAADRGDHLASVFPACTREVTAASSDLGVSKEQLDERLARVTRGADDADFHGRGTIRSVAFKIQ